MSELRKILLGNADPHVAEWADRLLENRPQRGQFLPDLQAHSPAMGQKDGEKWTAAVDLQPAIPKSDRLLDPRPVGDGLIAATALVQGMTVVTRHVADFQPTGVAVFNPWVNRAAA